MVVFAFVVVVVSFKEEGITWWLWWWCWVVVVVVAAPPPPRRVDFLAPSRWRWWWFFSSFSSSSSFPVSVGAFETSRSCCFITVYREEIHFSLFCDFKKRNINNARVVNTLSLSRLSSMSRVLERSRSSSIQSATWKTTKLACEILSDANLSCFCVCFLSSFSYWFY